jgi:hypothetical protein
LLQTLAGGDAEDADRAKLHVRATDKGSEHLKSHRYSSPTHVKHELARGTVEMKPPVVPSQLAGELSQGRAQVHQYLSGTSAHR